MLRPPLLISLLLLISGQECFNSSALHANDPESNDCCPLVWREMEGYLIPHDAIIAGRVSGISSYYTRTRNMPWAGPTYNKPTMIGVKLEGMYYINFTPIWALDFNRIFWRQDGNCLQGCYYSSQWNCNEDCAYVENTQVLTNPYGCELTWFMREIPGQMPSESFQFLYPFTYEDTYYGRYINYFARHQWANKDIGAGVVMLGDDSWSTYYREVYLSSASYTQGSYFTDEKNTEMMGIDCYKSIKSLVTAELYNISFNIDELID